MVLFPHPQQKTVHSFVTNVTRSLPTMKPLNNTCFRCTATSHTSVTVVRQLSATRETLPATRQFTQVTWTTRYLKFRFRFLIYWHVLFLGLLLKMLLCLQEKSRIVVISVALSSTDQLTSRPTLESTQEKSHTNVRHAELVLYRWVPLFVAMLLYLRFSLTVKGGDFWLLTTTTKKIEYQRFWIHNLLFIEDETWKVFSFCPR